MKKLLTYIAVIATVFVFTPNIAEARGHSHGSHTYISGHTACGCPIYTQKYLKFHDRYGQPVYGYRALPSTCRGTCARSSHHQARGHKSRYHHKRGHYNKRTHHRGYRHNPRRHNPRGCGRTTYRR